MRNIITALALLTVLFLQAQKTFSPIDTSSAHVCRTALHNEYKKKFEASNKSIASATSKEKNIIKGIYSELQTDFLEKIEGSNFICDNTINSYLQNLMEEVLSKNGVRKDSYKILLSRNPDANAYNTGDGTIVVHYGLFLTVENEDELVFVISHEIGHQFLNHVANDINSFARLSTSEEVVNKTREIRNKKYGKATMAGGLLKSIKYQNYSQRRKKEIEADSIGLAFYRKTNRNTKAAITILEKLDHSDKEKDSLTIADYKAIFNSDTFKVKERYFDREESLFKQYDKTAGINVDSLKSHPDCATRIKMIKDYLDDSFGENFSNSATFAEVKANSAYQNLINLYSEEEYGISLYEALKLYKHDSSNPILKNIIYLNLDKIKASRVNYTINRYVPGIDNKKHTESLNRFITFVNNIKNEDYNIIINNFKN